MQISHSAKDRFNTCKRSYDLHYNQKIRPVWTTSALLFGGALDLALNEILLKTGNDPYEVFKTAWSTCEINRQFHSAPACTKILYTTKDFDIDVFTQETYAEISQRITSGEVKEFNYDDLVQKKKVDGWMSLNSDEQAYHNLVNWYSMRNKAKYLIDAYITDIMPEFEKIEVVQKEIAADNGAGDTLKGFIDLIAVVKGHGQVILDNKTSSAPYNRKKLDESEQLSLYAHMEGIPKIGYIVLVKNLKKDTVKTCKSCRHVTESSHKTCNNTVNSKRCDGAWSEVIKIRVQTQMMIQDVNAETEERMLNNFDSTVQEIHTGEFPMVEDVGTCLRMFGNRCPYYDLCHNQKMDGLIDLKEVK